MYKSVCLFTLRKYIKLEIVSNLIKIKLENLKYASPLLVTILWKKDFCFSQLRNGDSIVIEDQSVQMLLLIMGD